MKVATAILCIAYSILALLPNQHIRAQTITVTSNPELMWDRSVHKCDENDTADSAFRPYRVGNVPLNISNMTPNYNKIVGFSTHPYQNYPMVGDSLENMTRVCSNASLESEFNPEYSAHRNYEWLISFWASGRLITSIIHNEYQGHHYNNQCNSYSDCWWNSLTMAHSFFNGRSFDRDILEDERIVAARPGPFVPNSGPTGFFSASNIVYDQSKNAFFMLIQVEPRRDIQNDYIESGVCLLKAQPRNSYGMKFPDFEWRAWDGVGFNSDLARGESCQTIPTISKMKGNITYNTVLNKWIVVGTVGGSGHSFFSIYYSTSDNLIDWSPRTLLLPVEHPVNNGAAYPSIVDPDSPGQNFMFSDDEAYLYYVKFNNGHGGLDRDIMRVTLSIAP